MPDSDLSQQEADALIRAVKHREDDREWDFPVAGGKLKIPLKSPEYNESFLLDISRNRIDLKQSTYQNRVRTSVVLLRLDLAGPPHRNPDDVEVECPHLHIYREGFDDKWAYPLPADFTDATNLASTLQEFMTYCNITVPPRFRPGLFT